MVLFFCPDCVLTTDIIVKLKKLCKYDKIIVIANAIIIFKEEIQ